MNDKDIGCAFEEWAHNRPDVPVVLLLGSRARRQTEIGSADGGSDWDFHVVASNISLFMDAGWTRSAGLSAPLAYVARPGRISPVAKTSALFPEGGLDLVLLSLAKLQVAKLMMRIGLAERNTRIRNALAHLTLVLSPGYRIVKGDSSWKRFFTSVISQIPAPRLDDHSISEIMDAYVIDYESTRRKILRGEYLAAQRWLHTQLAETSFRLLHELRLRSNKPTFPDGRRLESICDDRLLNAMRVSSLPDRKGLLDALEKNAQTCREIAKELVGTKWRWPEILL